MNVQDKIAAEISTELSNIAWGLCKNFLGVELNRDVDQAMVEFQKLTNNDDDSNVVTNIYYGIELIGSVKISMNEDFSANFEVTSKYN